MKRILLSAFLLCSCASQRGLFVDRGLFNNSPFASATANSPEDARALALAAIPPGFGTDPEFAEPVLSCGAPGEAPVAGACASGLYRVDLALLPAAGDEREAILRTRKNLASMEKAEGPTTQ